MSCSKLKPIGVVCKAGSFSERWTVVLSESEISWRAVNPFANDIVEDLRHISALLWHIHHFSPAERMIARYLLTAANYIGVPSFPGLETVASFDDKVAQKYQLEAVGAPLVPSYVFFQQGEALAWARATSYPKVFKLRCGAGSRNVRLVRDATEASTLIRQAFQRGFPVSGGNIADAALS